MWYETGELFDVIALIGRHKVTRTNGLVLDKLGTGLSDLRACVGVIFVYLPSTGPRVGAWPPGKQDSKLPRAPPSGAFGTGVS